MIYLCSPYSHSDKAVRVKRWEDALRATIGLLQAGKVVFSPIVYNHQMVEAGMGTSWDAWRWFDREMIQRSWGVWILTLDGWRESKGVQAEIELASEMGKPMRCVSLEECVEGRV